MQDMELTALFEAPLYFCCEGSSLRKFPIHLLAKVRSFVSTEEGVSQGRSQGEEGNPHPRNRKCRKMVLFPKTLFLVTNFQK